ncbi:MAG: glycosyltransferase family 4 protein [Deltaproteobacteria bacterium]|nr:glycosyltransferase family 4 protein [Deltaproteobacteria bacterium]
MAGGRPHLFILNERDLANPRAGGVEVHLFEIFSRLAARGFPVTLICAGYAGAVARETVRGLDVRHVGNRYTFYVRGPALYRRLARAHVGAGVLIEDLSKLPFFAALYSPLPILAIVHHLFGTTAFQQVSVPVAAVTYLSELAIPRVYRSVPMIAVSPSTRDDLIVRGVRASNISVITNGLDHTRYRPAPTRPGPGPVILSLGRVERYKRIDVVIDAMPRILAAVPAARFVVVGRGDALPDLQRRARALGVADAVEFRGFVDEDEKVALYQSARVFVNPSEKEGWGLTVMEANACGVPVVASDAPGLRDSVHHESTGLLVPYGDVAAWTDAILRVLQDDAAWSRWRSGALAWAAEFSWDAIADQTEAMIARVLESRRA